MKKTLALVLALCMACFALPVLAETFVIDAIRPGSGLPAPKDDVIKAALDEALGMDLQLSVLGSNTDYFNQLSIRLASGSAPDIFWVNNSNLKSFVSKNLILDLTDYYQNELKQTADWLGEATMKLATVNGRFYGIPNPNQFTYSTEWVRTDWLKNVGLSMPTTLEEFYQVAYAFTFNDPDGNGQQDTFGMAGTNFTALNPILSYYGIPDTNSFYEKNGKLTHSVYDPDMPAALAKMQEFIQAGVVDPEIFSTQTEQILAAKAFQNQVGMVYIGWSGFAKNEHIEQMKAGNPNAEWAQLPAMEGLYGAVDGRYEAATTNHMFALPASLPKNPEKLAKVFELVNYVSSPEGSNVVCYGIEGTHFEIVNGVVTKKEGSNWGEIGHVWFYQFTGRPDEFEYLRIRFPDQEPVIAFAASQPRIETYNGFVNIPEDYLPDDANIYMEEELLKFAYGQRPLSEYDQFVETLNNTFGFAAYYDQAVETIAAVLGE